MLMSSIKERKEVSLSQNTIALKGFVLSLQLVMVEAIPALTEVVNDGSSSGSEGDGGEDDDLVDEDKNGKRSISPGHARDTDAAGKIPVSSSAQTVNVSNVARDGQHPDIRRTSLHHVGIHTESAENDIINDTIRFANQTTSLTVDVRLNGGQGIQLDVPSENQTPRVIPEKWSRTTPYSQTKKHHPQTRQVIQPVIHTENQTRRDSHEEMITDDPPDAILFSNQANTFAVDVLNGAQEIQSSIHTEYQTLRGGAQKSGAEDMNLDHELLFPKPTFSLGLTQAERPHWKETVTEGASMCENDVDHSQSSPDTNLDHELPFPKPTFSLGLTHEECPHPKEAVTEGETMLAKKFANRRISWVPAGKYECDMRLLNRARVAFVDPDNTGGNIDYVAKLSYLLDKLKSLFQKKKSILSFNEECNFKNILHRRKNEKCLYISSSLRKTETITPIKSNLIIVSVLIK
ncbi:unnamed protein product [Brassica oleracea]